MSTTRLPSSSAAAPAAASSAVVPHAHAASANPNNNSAAAAAATSAISRLPSAATMERAVRIAILEDRPLVMDYWVASLDADVKKRPFIGVLDTNERMLVKSAEEHTSYIVKMFKTQTDYIIMTENSIYLVSNEIAARKVSM